MKKEYYYCLKCKTVFSCESEDHTEINCCPKCEKYGLYVFDNKGNLICFMLRGKNDRKKTY